IREAREVGLVIGLEIPAVVDGNGEKSCYSRGLFHLVEYAVREGLDLVNINELEASHTNMDALVERGYELVGDSMAVAGSRELAMDVIDRISKKYPKSRTSLHFCSSVYKDSIQLRHRLRRMAKNLKRPFEIDTEDGTLVRGTVVTEDPEGLMSRLESDAGVPEELMEAGDGELLIAAWVLEEIAPDLDENCFISEVYPTWDGLEVERTPIG
ncbi:MAG: radical SAM protein, partial [Candidatus Thermoplasmatota archaeon]|nr:radical SAM protein [Candidatus Thermoplasmatota archaeon]